MSATHATAAARDFRVQELSRPGRSWPSIDGVTAIVGPNGCGKSNVVDAITWVLGEQSAKSLRGERMEDVIFSGSDARKPTAAAEVRLRLRGVAATAARRPPARPGARRRPAHDADRRRRARAGRAAGDELREVEIARRLYRSGESEYLIDGEVVPPARRARPADGRRARRQGLRRHRAGQDRPDPQRQAHRPPAADRGGGRRHEVQVAPPRRRAQARSGAAEPHARRRHRLRGREAARRAEAAGGQGAALPAAARGAAPLGEGAVRPPLPVPCEQAIEAARARLDDARAREHAAAARAWPTCRRRSTRRAAACSRPRRRPRPRAKPPTSSSSTPSAASSSSQFDRQQVETLGDALETSRRRSRSRSRRGASPAAIELEERRGAAAAPPTTSAARRPPRSTDAEQALSRAQQRVSRARARRSTRRAGRPSPTRTSVSTLRNAIERAREASERLAGELARLDAEAADIRVETERVAAEREVGAARRCARRRAPSRRPVPRAPAREADLATARIEREWRVRRAAHARARARRARGAPHVARGARGRRARATATRRGLLADASLGIRAPRRGRRLRWRSSLAPNALVEACLGDLLQYVIVVDARRGARAASPSCASATLGRCGFVVDRRPGARRSGGPTPDGVPVAVEPPARRRAARRPRSARPSATRGWPTTFEQAARAAAVDASRRS